ncbi:MAG: hypothetical protein HUK40_14510 [Desulfobacter sp.]|nr:hypothetical protein [Desulfobacter sp.]
MNALEIRASVFPGFQDPKIPSATSRWMDKNLDENRWYADALDVDDLDDIRAHSHFPGYTAGTGLCMFAICFRQFQRPAL